jgi:integrase
MHNRNLPLHHHRLEPSQIDDHDWHEQDASHSFLLETSESPNTRRAHRSDLVYFWIWANVAAWHAETYPVPSSLVQRFIIEHLGGMSPEVEVQLTARGIKAKSGPHKFSTIRRRLASLAAAHTARGLPSPCATPAIRQLLSRAARHPDSYITRKRAITRDILEAMIDTCGDSLVDLRDKALLLVAFASGGRRRSELVALEVSDLGKVEGGYTLTLKRSKTDQLGQGMQFPVRGRAAQALDAWLKAAHLRSGKLFRSVAQGRLGKGLSDRTVARIVKRRLLLADYDPEHYGAHSLRSGFLTESGRRGIHLGEAMALSGHKSVEVALRYYRVGGIHRNPAARLLED